MEQRIPTDDPTPTFDVPSKPRLRYRRTRIAVSVFFGLMSVALCLLWVRSYWWMDSMYWSNWRHFCGLSSCRGKLQGNVYTADTNYGILPILNSQLLREHGSDSIAKVPSGAEIDWADKYAYIVSPTYSLILFFGSLAILPWLSPRFSVRTLLFATTVVAAVLGLGAWLVT